jgi:hypothetical protein
MGITLVGDRLYPSPRRPLIPSDVVQGLHSTVNGANLTPFDSETRKRIWWCLVVHESGCTLTFGLPFGFGSPRLVPPPVNNHDEVRSRLILDASPLADSLPSGRISPSKPRSILPQTPDGPFTRI